MVGVFVRVSLAALVVLATLSVVNAQITPTDPCTFSLGPGLNFSFAGVDAQFGPFVGNDNSQTPNSYYWNLCSAITGNAPANFPVANPPSAAVCTTGGPNVNCQLSFGTWIWVGALGSQTAQTLVTGGSGVTLKYGGGKTSTGCNSPPTNARNTIMNLQCDQSTATPTVIPPINAEGCTYTISMKGKQFCPITAGPSPGPGPNPSPAPVPVPTPPKDDSGKPAIDGGWIFIIILAGLLVIYLVVGIIVKIKKYDAKGIEVIPNIDFWKDLPFLCKDGVMFVVNKIRGRTYDQV